MNPLQVVPTRPPSSLLAWLAALWPLRREARTPMGGRIIRLGGPSAAAPWALALALLVVAPMLLVGVVSMV